MWPPKVDLPGYRPVTKAHGKQIQAAAHLLATAKKPCSTSAAEPSARTPRPS